jgi:hypothetical protein
MANQTSQPLIGAHPNWILSPSQIMNPIKLSADYAVKEGIFFGEK